MNRRFVPLALALATVLPLAFASATAENPNARYFLDALGFETAPHGVALVRTHAGVVESSIAEAIAQAAARAGNVEIAAIAQAAGEPAGDLMCVGDCWLLEIGAGACPPATIIAAAPVPLPSTPFIPQASLYAGAIGMGSTNGPTQVIDWTTKGMLGGVAPNGVTFAGLSDFFCVSFFGLYIFFPFVDGIVTAN